MTIRSLDTSLETKRDIQLVGLLSSSPVRPNGMILRAGKKKENMEDLASSDPLTQGAVYQQSLICK